MDFIIDTVGELGSASEIDAVDNRLTEKAPSSVLAELLRFKQQIESKYDKPPKPEATLKPDEAMTKAILEDLGWKEKGKSNVKKRKKNEKNSVKISVNSADVKTALSKSVITEDFEKLHSVPPYEISKRKLQEERRKEREKTKGHKWYGLPATEMTDEVKRDLEILQMRSVLDPKHFYKKNDLKVLPKYFQVGKVVDSPLDFYNNRLTKRERKKTLVDELLADAEFQKYNKRKYKEIIEEKQKTHYKAWRQAKRLKRKK